MQTFVIDEGGRKDELEKLIRQLTKVSKGLHIVKVVDNPSAVPTGSQYRSFDVSSKIDLREAFEDYFHLPLAHGDADT